MVSFTPTINRLRIGDTGRAIFFQFITKKLENINFHNNVPILLSKIGQGIKKIDQNFQMSCVSLVIAKSVSKRKLSTFSSSPKKQKQKHK